MRLMVYWQGSGRQFSSYFSGDYSGISLALSTLSICLEFPPCPILHCNKLKAASLLTNGIHSKQRASRISGSSLTLR